MKKIFTSILILTILCSLIIFPANAVEKYNASANETVIDVEYLDNGDYIVTTIDNNLPEPDVNTPNATTVTKTKTKNYYNSAGNVMWYIKVQGTFTYNGTSSKCTSAAHKAAALGTSWSIKSASSSKSGNTATAKAVAVHKTSNGNKEYSASVTIKCSKTGVIS